MTPTDKIEYIKARERAAKLRAEAADLEREIRETEMMVEINDRLVRILDELAIGANRRKRLETIRETGADYLQIAFNDMLTLSHRISGILDDRRIISNYEYFDETDDEYFVDFLDDEDAEVAAAWKEFDDANQTVTAGTAKRRAPYTDGKDLENG